MSRDWQAPFRLLHNQFLAAANESHNLKLALGTFPDHAAYSAWYDGTVQRDLEWELASVMNQRPGRPTRASARGTVWGLEEGVRRFDTLAREAGSCLPFDFHPAVRLFPCFNDFANLAPDPVTLWSEFLFVARHNQFRLSHDWPRRGCRVATLESNPFMTSASAIDQYILAPGAPDLDGYFRLMRTVCPWLPNLVGGVPMMPPGIVTPPHICPDLPEVFRRAIELEAALVARSGGAAVPGWVNRFLADADADRAVRVAAERLLCGVNPRMAKVSDWSRHIDYMEATADARQALRTLGLAVADIRGEFDTRGRNLLAAGARHLWVGMTAEDRVAAQELLPVGAEAWGWSEKAGDGPTTYDGPRATLEDPRVIDHQWETRGRDYLGELQASLVMTNFSVDSITLPGGRRFDVYRDDVKPSRMSLPAVCPNADPKPPEELRPPGVMLAELDFRFRDLGLVGPDESIHWVGRLRRRDHWCTCDLTPASLAAPRPHAWHQLRDLRAAIVAMTGVVDRYTVGPRRGAVLSEADRSMFDHLAGRVTGLVRALALTLPPTAPPPRVRTHGPTSLPIVERPSGLAVAVEEIDRWVATWQEVRIGIDARLEQHDRTLRADGTPAPNAVDLPLEAPVGTPASLKAAYEAVAAVLVDAATLRQEPPSDESKFIAAARGLGTRIDAAQAQYAAAELALQLAADAAGCAHRDALAAVLQVNDPIRRVAVVNVPGVMAVAHVRQVPAPDLRGLLRRMREQVSRAATTAGRERANAPSAPARVRCDANDRSVYLDGKRLVGELPPHLFHFFRVIAEHHPDPIPFSKIQDRAPGLRGKHQTRIKEQLPPELSRLIASGTRGYTLKVPPPK